MKLKIFILLSFILFSKILYANGQDGVIRGIVIDNEGQPIIGAYIKLSDIEGKITTSDIDGNFSLENLPEGTYKITVSYISMQSKIVENILVKNGPIDLGTIKLMDESVQLKDVVVTAQALKNTENAVQTIQRKSLSTIDGISNQVFSLSGDSDAASAIKRITGVSIQEGKYVFVRGLGGRYSMTVLNGLSIPGLDPDKNSVELDIFPTNIIDNIIVYKSFTPDLPGSFTGGLIDIQTKDFPTSLKTNLSIGAGYNPQSNLIKGFFDHTASSTDFLGFDDGSRDIPELIKESDGKLETAFVATNPDEANKLVKSFNKDVTVYETTKPLNYNLNFSIGNQVNIFNKPLGFIAGISYKRNYSFYDNGMTGRYLFISESSDTLGVQREYDEKRGHDDILAGAIFSSSLKLNNSNKIGFTYLLNIAGRRVTRTQSGFRVDENIGYSEKLLSYQERRFNTFQLRGNHNFGKNQQHKVDWAGSYSLTYMAQPDLKFLNNAYVETSEGVSYSIQPSIGLIPTRYWRNMNENTSSNTMDYTLNFKNWNGKKSSFKSGLALDWKHRDFDEHIYQFESLSNSFNGSFSSYFSDENLISSSNPKGVFVTDGSNPKNNYTASSVVLGSYAMTELPITEKLKSVFGVRMEMSKMNFTNVSFDNVLLMNDLDILPVFGMIYELVPDKMNVRLNYNRTLARPAFREIADVAFYEFMNNSFLLGNPDLKRTTIDNFDFRWEMFQTHGEKVTVSAFYKDFKNPIELTNNPEAKNGEWIYKNVKHATVIGFELDLIKKLDFISPLKDFSIGGNISLARSKASIDPNELANIKYHDPDALDTRQLYGQSPYLINAFISYQNKYGTSARVNYNVQGERLYLVEVGAKPDVFEQPFNLINLKISQKLTKYINISMGINNAFDDKINRTIKYKEKEYVFNSYKEGRTYTFSVSYDFVK